MIIKAIIAFALLLIFISLANGLFHLMRGKGDNTGVARALTWRVVLSILLVAFLLFAYWMGWLVPHEL